MQTENSLSCPLASDFVPAGFPSPAQDYVEKNLDLNTFLIKHPAATFFVRAQGCSMQGAGIHSGDILIVDRAREPKTHDIVIACLNGEFMVKRLGRNQNKPCLLSENPRFPPLKISDGAEISIWGVVTYVIHQCSP